MNDDLAARRVDAEADPGVGDRHARLADRHRSDAGRPIDGHRRPRVADARSSEPSSTALSSASSVDPSDAGHRASSRSPPAADRPPENVISSGASVRPSSPPSASSADARARRSPRPPTPSRLGRAGRAGRRRTARVTRPRSWASSTDDAGTVVAAVAGDGVDAGRRRRARMPSSPAPRSPWTTAPWTPGGTLSSSSPLHAATAVTARVPSEGGEGAGAPTSAHCSRSGYVRGAMEPVPPVTPCRTTSHRRGATAALAATDRRRHGRPTVRVELGRHRSGRRHRPPAPRRTTAVGEPARRRSIAKVPAADDTSHKGTGTGDEDVRDRGRLLPRPRGRPSRCARHAATTPPTTSTPTPTSCCSRTSRRRSRETRWPAVPSTTSPANPRAGAAPRPTLGRRGAGVDRLALPRRLDGCGRRPRAVRDRPVP